MFAASALQRQLAQQQNSPIKLLQLVSIGPSASQANLQACVPPRFPFAEPLTLHSGETVSSAQVVEAMSQFIAPERLARMDQVVANRTFNVLPIVEGVYDMGNLAAITRSSDALGMGAMHIINSGETKYKQSARHSAGAEKWLDVRMWSSARDCLQAAKASGYQVIVTHLQADAIDVREVDWTRPTAIVLGNERAGVSREVLEEADACAVVPMVGMVESLNVSVAAALMLHEARRGRLAALAGGNISDAAEPVTGYHGDLTPQEQDTLRAVMLLRHQGRSNQILSHLLARRPPQWQQHKAWTKELERNIAAQATAGISDTSREMQTSNAFRAALVEQQEQQNHLQDQRMHV